MRRFTSRLPTSEALQKHGHGELHYASGDVFVGMWVDDHAVGHGVLNYADGKVRANTAGRPAWGSHRRPQRALRRSIIAPAASGLRGRVGERSRRSLLRT